MINVTEGMKELYKKDSQDKSTFVLFRDLGKIMTDEDIVSESLSITESICSAGQFHMGLCESATASISINLAQTVEDSNGNEMTVSPNVKGDEMIIFQALDKVEGQEGHKPFEISFSYDSSLGRMASSVWAPVGFTQVTIPTGINTIDWDVDKYYIYTFFVQYVGLEDSWYLSSFDGNSRQYISYYAPNLNGLLRLPQWNQYKEYAVGDIVEAPFTINSETKRRAVRCTAAGVYPNARWEVIEDRIHFLEWDQEKVYGVGDRVSYNRMVWQSLINENSAIPDLNGSEWKDLTSYKWNAVVVHGSDILNYQSRPISTGGGGYFRLFETDIPLMPMGVFGITSCKRRNDSTIRDIQGYDRMQDVLLDEEVNMNFTGISSITLGEILSDAASETQILIGANGSKVSVSAVAVGDPVEEEITGFPTGVIYQTQKTETVQGTVSNSMRQHWYYAYTTGTWHDPVTHTDSQTIYATGGSGYQDPITGEWVWVTFVWVVPDGWYLPDTEAPTYMGQPTTVYRTVTDREGYYSWPSAPGNSELISESGNRRTYRVWYGHSWPSKYNSGWSIVSTSTVTDGGTSTQPCTRVYSQNNATRTWTVNSAKGRKQTYRIPNYSTAGGEIYEIYCYSPNDAGIIPTENSYARLRESGLSVQAAINNGGTLLVDRQQDIVNAFYNYSTHSTVELYEDGGETYFDITYGSYLAYDVSGYSSPGMTMPQNADPLLKKVERHSAKEKFNSLSVDVVNTNISTTRRAVISGFLELNGLFINFNRYGISQLRNIQANTLYPAENLYPHDSTQTGLENYGDIYPMEGSQEYVSSALCKSIYIDDDINPPFDGVAIIKSNPTAEEQALGLFPFYYNRLNKKYGELPSGMEETGFWQGNNYYVIQNNFFFDNFVFIDRESGADPTQYLKDICKEIIANIGDLQYFNMTAELKALPYLEVGDNINIMTPENGYETAILRRTMKGCQGMMDTIETDFYD